MNELGSSAAAAAFLMWLLRFLLGGFLICVYVLLQHPWWLV
jgi:hypothetical protein